MIKAPFLAYFGQRSGSDSVHKILVLGSGDVHNAWPDSFFRGLLFDDENGPSAISECEIESGT